MLRRLVQIQVSFLPPQQVRNLQMFYSKKKRVKVEAYGCETSKLPHFLDNRLTDGGEVSLTRRTPFTPQEDSWYSFLLQAESTSGP
jgi:hypothetical protein